MPSPVSALAPSPAERLARALNDLRMGLACVVADGAAKAVVAAVETLTPERLSALSALFGTPELVLSAHRARAVMTPVASAVLMADAVRIRPPENAGLDWYQRLAESAFDATTGPRGPLHVLRDADPSLAVPALQLAKSAELLPAVVLFPLAADSVLPRGLALGHIDLAQTEETAIPPVFAQIASARFPVRAADAGRLHVFRDTTGAREHYAFEVGSPDRALPVLARLHSACFTGDVLGSLKCDCGPQLHAALARMGDAGAGVLLYLNQEGRGIGLANKMRVYDLQAQGFDTVEANHRLGFEDDERDFRVAAVMLRSLGFSAARLLTNNPAKVQVFRAQGIAVTEQVPLRVGKNAHNSGYLATKALKSGHAL